jgi:hypothetical protein
LVVDVWPNRSPTSDIRSLSLTSGARSLQHLLLEYGLPRRDGTSPPCRERQNWLLAHCLVVKEPDTPKSQGTRARRCVPGGTRTVALACGSSKTVRPRHHLGPDSLREPVLPGAGAPYTPWMHRTLTSAGRPPDAGALTISAPARSYEFLDAEHTVGALGSRG